MTGALQEPQWEQLGLTVLSTDENKTLVLFSSSDELRDFRDRLAAYARGTQQGHKQPAYAGFIANIEEIGTVEPRDRIGVRFREQGFAGSSDFAKGEIYLFDLELWDLGRRDLRMAKLRSIQAGIEANGGEVLDSYCGPSISMLRVRAVGTILVGLLLVEDISSVDAPPAPDIQTSEAFNLAIENAPLRNEVVPEMPVVGIIDSGITDHPFIEDIIVGAIGIPATFGTADSWGHGTSVAGVAVFGDLRNQLQNGTLNRAARLCSAKVIGDDGHFDDERLIPNVIREAVTTLHERFGCRIFVQAIVDCAAIFDGRKVGAWAATLDELARELNVLIIGTTGNRMPRAGEALEEGITAYPLYLTEDQNRFQEPAGAMNILTVGALAHGEGIDATHADAVTVQPITRAGEPSPFSRRGPGIGGATKPDLIDIGGTFVFDAVVRRLLSGRELPSAGVLTLYNRPIDRLFTAGSGTSFAAPNLAFKASQLLARFPAASTNLLRALLVGSASVPDAASECLRNLGEQAISNICGHGLVDLEKAAFSDDARVVLYAEDDLALDHFAVYSVPVPDVFRSERGKRTIRVTLAFDPPVRYSRVDYAGVGMSFRLIRGCTADHVFEHFRRRPRDEDIPELENRYQCGLKPGPRDREKGTVQSASVTFSRPVDGYGDQYFLVVRCEGGWAASFAEHQKFAVVVELSQQAEVRLYERLRQRVRV